MKFSTKEKHFWRSNFRIGSLAELPSEMKEFRSIDSEIDDQFLFYLTSGIPTIHAIYLKFTNITDNGVKHISRASGLLELTLRDHQGITNKSIPFLNMLTDLRYLDILKTKIELEDLLSLSALKKLNELHISSENLDDEYLLTYTILMKEVLPSCTLYINYKIYE